MPSRWTRAELDFVTSHLRDRHDEWNVYQWGQSSTQDGQACITASLTRVLPEIAAWAASLPDGLLVLEPGSYLPGSIGLLIRSPVPGVR